MIDGLKVIAWITGESLSRLESGGNDSRGTVPVHVRHSRVAYRGLMLRSEVERLLTERDARIAQLERERDEAAKLFADLSPRAVELAKRVDELKRERDEMDVALRDCFALAARHRHEEWAQHVMRFCANGGVVPSPLRGES